jgi:hypothetical protein
MSQYSELIEYLNTKFSAIDLRFDSLELNKADKKDFTDLMNSVDAIAKKMDNYHKELSAHKYKVNRIEDWVTQAAPKIEVDYTA